MGKINNTNFFREKTTNTLVLPVAAIEPKIAAAPKLKVRRHVAEAISHAASELQRLGYDKMAQSVMHICREAASNRFAVCVVGEFNRGKSTLVNRLLGADYLPTGFLPTTAMLTRICYGKQQRLTLYSKSGAKQKELPLNPQAWQGLTAENFGGKDPEGFVVLNANNPWLGSNAIELIDSPGAGDLEEQRARQIGDALLRSDGVIIVVNATAAMSMSEELFVKQRVLTNHNPFMALVVSKLDLVPEDERPAVMEFIKKKLVQWQLDIPVFSSSDVEPIKELITSWTVHPTRLQLTEQWLTGRVKTIVDMARQANEEKLQLLDADDRKRAELLAQKRTELQRFGLEWNNLMLELQKCCNNCFNKFVEKEDEYVRTVVERLQYECAHSNAPKKWWKEDYPYRLKVELANVAVGLENLASTIIANDARWFNEQLERHFKSHVDFKRSTIVERDDLASGQSTRHLEVEDLNKKRNMVRAGTAALSIAGALALSPFGFMPLIATMGIGTGGSIMSETFFRGKIEEQQRNLKAAIAKDVPQIMANAMSDSEQRLRHVYDDLERGADESRRLWLETQNSAINASVPQQDAAARQRLNDVQQELTQIIDQLNV